MNMNEYNKIIMEVAIALINDGAVIHNGIEVVYKEDYSKQCYQVDVFDYVQGLYTIYDIECEPYVIVNGDKVTLLDMRDEALKEAICLFDAGGGNN